ncbi:MAG: primase-helicase zinc-binding domain-containing protein [Gammaproteobacteria bacterium]
MVSHSDINNIKNALIGINGYKFLASRMQLPPFKKPGPCPYCNGVDRFVYDAKNLSCEWFCRHHGSGDALQLLIDVEGINFVDAIKICANYFGIALDEQPRHESKQSASPPKRVITTPEQSVSPQYSLLSPPTTRKKSYSTAVKIYKVINRDAKNRDDCYVAEHLYCKKKGIDWAVGAGRGVANGKLLGENADCVIVPMHFFNGDFAGVECINSIGLRQTFGNKAILKLGNDLDQSLTAYVVEGWASGCAQFIRYNGHVLVLVCFGKNQMNQAAIVWARMHPKQIILIHDENDDHG